MKKETRNTQRQNARKRKAEMRMLKIAERVRKQLQDEMLATHQPQSEVRQNSNLENGPGSETSLLIRFLQEHYEFRYNLMTGYAEYRQQGGNAWTPVGDREVNTLTMKARLEGINIWNSDTKRFVWSHMVTDYHPVNSYFERVKDTWDGQDRVTPLALTVKTNCRQWTEWFHRWMLAMVAQWTGKNTVYGNSVAPLLISGQGFHKSTFCKSLLPPELSWGYMDNLLIAEKKQVMQAMNQMLLINLDEFNQISPTIQTGFLKNVIQLSTVKMRRPYGNHVEDFPRMASFIATTNMTDVLSDPTGNRRFICVELTQPVDVSIPPCHDQLYAQLLHELEQGERYWFDEADTRHIIEHNRQYLLKNPIEDYFSKFFEVTTDEEKGEYMNATAIYDFIRRRIGSSVPQKGVINFGRMLANINGIVRRRSNRGSEYLVALRS